MLIEKLRGDQLSARRDKKTFEAGILTILVSEAAMVGKNDGNRDSTDAEVLAMIRTFRKNAGTTRTALVEKAGSADAIKDVDAEIEILDRYLPMQMSQKELTRVIEAIVEAKPDAQMKDVMASLSRDHKGTYDGRMANGIATEVLKQAARG